MAAFSLGRRKDRLRGDSGPLAAGLLFGAAGLAWFARAPWTARSCRRLPGMVLLGIGAGIASSDAAGRHDDVSPSESGLVGRDEHRLHDGRALGLAVLASFAAMRPKHAGQRRGVRRGFEWRISLAFARVPGALRPRGDWRGFMRTARGAANAQAARQRTSVCQGLRPLRAAEAASCISCAEGAASSRAV